MILKERRDLRRPALTGAIKSEDQNDAQETTRREWDRALRCLHTCKNPKTAMQVTARLRKKLFRRTRRAENEAESALKFFDDELSRIKIELEKKEEQITTFKRSHLGELPQQTDASFRSLDRLDNDINTVNENIQRHSDKLAMLDKAVQEYQIYGRQNPAFKTASMEPDPLFRQLKELREKLVMLKAEFRDEYPDVILTKEGCESREEWSDCMSGRDQIRQKTTRPYFPGSFETTERGKKRTESSQATGADSSCQQERS